MINIKKNIDKMLFYLLVLLVEQAVLTADTTSCPKGFAITAANVCSPNYGPCATTDYVATTSTYATSCSSCYDDAGLYSIIKGATFAGGPTPLLKTCVPNACDSVYDSSQTFPGRCYHCITGYSLTLNFSCILNGGSGSSTPSTASVPNSSVSSSPSSGTQTVTNGSNTSNNTSDAFLPLSFIICTLLFLCFKLYQLKKQQHPTVIPNNQRHKQNKAGKNLGEQAFSITDLQIQ